MSAVLIESRGGERAALAVGLGAVIFLLTRQELAPLGVAGLAAGYAGLAAASIAVVPRNAEGRAHPGWAVPLAVGCAAVTVARALAGPAPPLRAGVMVLTLNVAAAVSEEAFFRGFLFGRLERWGAAVAVVASALAFALIHVPLYGTAAFPVDLGAGLLLSWQRAATGGWSVPAATHTLANLLVVIP